MRLGGISLREANLAQTVERLGPQIALPLLDTEHQSELVDRLIVGIACEVNLTEANVGPTRVIKGGIAFGDGGQKRLGRLEVLLRNRQLRLAPVGVQAQVGGGVGLQKVVVHLVGEVGHVAGLGLPCHEGQRVGARRAMRRSLIRALTSGALIWSFVARLANRVVRRISSVLRLALMALRISP